MTDDTRKPVEELSGRELDAAVAEEVLGVDVSWFEYDENWGDWLAPATSDVGPARLPLYSTDIAAAWEVLTGVDWFEWQMRSTADLHGVTCSICPDMESWHRASADTAPEAICRAALKAVRTER